MCDALSGVEVIYDAVCDTRSDDDAANDDDSDDVSVSVHFDVGEVGDVSDNALGASDPSSSSGETTTSQPCHVMSIAAKDTVDAETDDGDDDGAGYESYANVFAYRKQTSHDTETGHLEYESGEAVADEDHVTDDDVIIAPPDDFSNESCNNYDVKTQNGDSGRGTIHNQIENCLRSKPKFVLDMMTSQQDYEAKQDGVADTSNDTDMGTTVTDTTKKAKDKSKRKAQKEKQKTLAKRYSMDDFNLSEHQNSAKDFMTVSKSDYNFNKLKKQLKRPFSTVFLPAINRKYNSISILFQR